MKRMLWILSWALLLVGLVSAQEQVFTARFTAGNGAVSSGDWSLRGSDPQSIHDNDPIISIPLSFNGQSFNVNQDEPRQLDQYTSIQCSSEYNKRHINTNTLQGEDIIVNFLTQCQVFLDSSFLTTSFPLSKNKEFVSFKEPFTGTVDISNAYKALEGVLTVQKSSGFLFITQLLKSESFPFMFSKGTSTFIFPSEATSLKANDINIIPNIIFKQGMDAVGIVEGGSSKRSFIATPSGVSIPKPGAQQINLNVIQQKNAIELFFGRIADFFRGIFG